ARRSRTERPSESFSIFFQSYRQQQKPELQGLIGGVRGFWSSRFSVRPSRRRDSPIPLSSWRLFRRFLSSAMAFSICCREPSSSPFSSCAGATA
uniref:Uncharacterized protein n=1 Tax=Oryzias sinensis TaxID=183150 RepID=A0A8C7WUG2_9TELE